MWPMTTGDHLVVYVYDLTEGTNLSFYTEMNKN